MKNVILFILTLIVVGCSEKEQVVEYTNEYFPDGDLKDSMVLIKDHVIERFKFDDSGDLELYYRAKNLTDSIDYGMAYAYYLGDSIPFVIAEYKNLKKHGLVRFMDGDSVRKVESYVNGVLEN